MSVYNSLLKVLCIIAHASVPCALGTPHTCLPTTCLFFCHQCSTTCVNLSEMSCVAMHIRHHFLEQNATLPFRAHFLSLPGAAAFPHRTCLHSIVCAFVVGSLLLVKLKLCVLSLSSQLEVSGVRPLTLSVDNYYKPREECPKDEEGKYNFETPGRYTCVPYSFCVCPLPLHIAYSHSCPCSCC